MRVPDRVWYWCSALFVVIGAIALLASLVSLVRHSPPNNTKQWQPTEQIKEVTDVPRTTVQTPRGIRVLDKAKAAQRLKLDVSDVGGAAPKPGTLSASDEVVAAAALRPSERRLDVVAVTDTATGETRLVSREAPAALLTLDQRASVSLDYGYRLSADRLVPESPGFRLTGRYDFAQVKGVNLGLTATLDQDGTTFVGVGVRYAW